MIADNKLNLSFVNRSNYFGLAGQVPDGKKIRGETMSGIFFDEIAFQDYAKDSLRAALKTIGKTGRITMVSTPAMSYYYEIIHDLTKAA